jgi:DNA modification methylase
MNLDKVVIGDTTIYHGDCFDIMPTEIKDKSVDAIIADLPYGTTKCKWDSVLDLDRLWTEYKRVLKDGGVVILFAQTPFDKVLGCSNLKWLKYEWIWEKTQATGFFNAKKMPMKAHENILVFYDKLPKYNPQKTKGHKPMNSYTKKVDVQNRTELYGKSTKEISGGGDTDRYPRSVQVFASDKQKNKLDGTIHPTQKPLELIKMLIKTYTDAGDLVLDNTTGSGTLNVGCIELGRKSIGIEKDKVEFDKAVARCKKVEGYESK